MLRPHGKDGKVETFPFQENFSKSRCEQNSVASNELIHGIGEIVCDVK
jgi:hypothetical protein